MSDLLTALDLLDLAVASSDGLASEPHREAAARVAAAARLRRDYFGKAVVVAIAGGTGSGKSSLLNAIAGTAVVPTSAIRPHTDEPLAWIPEGDQAIAGFVAELGISAVVEHGGDTNLAVIDLPDLDSVQGQHRDLVERMIPLVDAVVWLFDPIKYHDPSIHREFLAAMTAYEPVFVFALNKVDRLDEAESEAVAAHLTGILGLDGFEEPTVILVAADPPVGSPIGIDELMAAIGRRLIVTRADRVKLVGDLLGAGRRLAADAALWGGTPDGSYDRIREAVNDPERLSAILTEMGIEGPLRRSIEAADGRTLDGVLLRRSELAATVAALGVECAGLAAYTTRSTS